MDTQIQTETVSPATKGDSATTETPITNVDANMFRAAYVCVSREETRYYLNGVYITPHPERGALLIATDGHRMIVIRDESAWCQKPVIVRVSKAGLDACKPVRKPKKELAVPRLVIGEDGVAVIDGVWRSPKSVLIDGAFPDWRRVVPFDAKWERATAAFNPSLIAGFAEIGAILALSKEPRSLQILTDGAGDPALIQMGDIRHAYGVLMPMRASFPPLLPAWMKPIAEAVQAEKAAALQAEVEAAQKRVDEAKKAATPAVIPRKRKGGKPKPKRTKRAKTKRRRA